MGWKGTVRSVGTAIRAAERDAKRRQRELERQQKERKKMAALEQAAYEVEVYENHIDIIQSLHKECSPRIDWNQVANTPKPSEPRRSKKNEDSARSKAKNYRPSLVDRVFKKERKKRQHLHDNISAAQDTDKKSYEENLKKWELEVTDWEESIQLAKLIINGDNQSKIDVIEELNPFSEISNLGSSLSFSIHENSIVEAEVYIHANDIVPSQTKSLLQSGRLSVKNMPKGKFNEIFQDYVCSCVLRVANELFSILPNNLVVVTTVDNLHNSKTGHLEKSSILSVIVSRKTLESLNMDNIDPSDSMSNFVHNMSFKKTQGFEAVKRVDTNELINT